MTFILGETSEVSKTSEVYIVQYPQAKTFLGFKKSGMPTPPVFGELQEKFFFVASMGNVPHLFWNMMSVGSLHT
jgi:hypothetical protein